ncbi:MAG: T9SS type A sorting domain-containing protein, partial [Bacteroidota bacterium]
MRSILVASVILLQVASGQSRQVGMSETEKAEQKVSHSLSPFTVFKDKHSSEPLKVRLKKRLIEIRDEMLRTRYGKIHQQRVKGNLPSGLKADKGMARLVKLPERFELFQNYPNPFNPTTTISYQLPASGYVTLRVYDVLGREVRSFNEGLKDTGSYEVEWNTT